MKSVFKFAIWIGLLSTGCQSKLNQAHQTVKAVLKVSPIEVNKNEVELHPEKGLVYHGGHPFTGTSIAYYDNNIVSEKADYLNGRQHGYHRKWFDTGLLSYEAVHKDGYQNGASRSWWKNGNMRSYSQYITGKMNGIQTQWYTSGALFKERNIVMNLEEGMQRSWRENGKIYNNYEARNGRIFGLKRANLCYSVDDEEIQLSK